MSNHITKLRLLSGIKTAKEAATRLSISSGMMYQVEEGIKKPGSLLATNMACLFNCSLDEIFLPFFITKSDKEKEAIK